MLARALIVALCLAAGAELVASASRAEVAIAREPLDRFPFELGTWRGERIGDFDAETLAVLKVDEYINRRYVNVSQRMIVGLYVGYYRTQRRGATIHSPLNCLPGAGWQAVQMGTTTIASEGSDSPGVRVNRYVVQRGGERQLVLYWYQGRGRVVANDYMNKFYLILDAARLHRSDGSLVRIMTPILTGESAADRAAGEFARVALPTLVRSIS